MAESLGLMNIWQDISEQEVGRRSEDEFGFADLERRSVAFSPGHRPARSRAQPGEVVVPLLQVFGRKLILAPNEIPDETCQTLAVGVIIPLEIEDWEDGRAIEPNPALTKRLANDLGKWG